MPANTSPIFPKTAVIGIASISTASVIRSYSGSSTLSKILDAGADGTRIDSVEVIATASTTAGMVRLVLSDGTNYKLLDEVVVSAITVSGTVPAFTKTLSYPDAQSVGGTIINRAQLVLPTGWSLWCGTEKAEAFNVIAFGGNY